MATSKVYQGFIPKLETDYTNFLTPVTGVSITQFRLEQVDNNLLALYMTGTIENGIASGGQQTIANYNDTVFGFNVINGYVLADLQVTESPAHYFGKLSFGSTGNIVLSNYSEVSCNKFVVNGVIYKRIDE